MKKSIGLLIPILVSGGAERALSIISNILAKKYNVYVFVFDSSIISYNYSGQLIDLNCAAKKNTLLKIYTRIKRIIKLRKFKKKLNLDVVISFLNAANMVNIFSRDSCKVYISCRGYSNYMEHREKYAKYIQKIDKVIFQTDRMKEEFINEFKVDKSKISVISNPFEIDKIKDKCREDIDNVFANFTNGKKTLITVGSFKRDKGFWHLIKVFTLIWQQYKDVCLIFVGHMGEMEYDILKMADDSPAKDNILFMGYQANPFKYIANSDIYVCSSIHEGFPNTIVESLACGTVVVSSDCKTGPREILNPNGDGMDNYFMAKYGVLCPPFTEQVDFDSRSYNNLHEIYRDAILFLLDNEEIMQHFSRMGKKRSLDFSSDKFSRKIIELIDE